MVVVLTGRFGVHYVAANLASLLALLIARFLVADQWIWRRALPRES